MVKVSVDKNKCIGCGACANLCDNFVMKNGKSHVVNPNPKELGCNEKAAKSCPTKAIKVTK
nr:ferredoxin [Nanoarchaeum sp.]